MRTALLALRIRKLLWLLRRRKWWSLLRVGTGPSIEHAELFVGHRYRSVVDIGANVGQFALWAQSSLRPGQVVCVEPQPNAATRIAEVARRSSCPITVITAALGDAEGRGSLFVTAANDSSSLLIPDNAARESSRAMIVADTIDVPVLVGDDVLTPMGLERPLLLKIDVQGVEDRVLLGLEETLRQTDAVLVEVCFRSFYEGQASPSTVVEFLLQRGFSLSAIARVPGVPGRWRLDQADLLFLRT